MRPARKHGLTDNDLVRIWHESCSSLFWRSSKRRPALLPPLSSVSATESPNARLRDIHRTQEGVATQTDQTSPDSSGATFSTRKILTDRSGAGKNSRRN